jgi:aminomethyltransferase
MLKTTPFIDAHRRSGAKLIDFGGYLMPVQYAGIVKEHEAVRQGVGLFDVSHMGEILVEGPQALRLVQHVTVNDASVLTPGRAQYSAMCQDDGGIVDDLLVYCLAPDRFMLVVNASNQEKDLAWIHANNRFDAKVTDIGPQTALLAVQGPKAAELLQPFTDTDLGSIPYYHFATGAFMGIPDVILSATGYTGEKGFELYMRSDAAVGPSSIWDSLLSAGAEPCGLGARDSLRLEMGYPLYGNDISDRTTPLEAGLGWITKLGKGPFIGKDALEARKQAGIRNKLVGFVMSEERAIPRSRYRILDAAGDPIGEVTSGGPSIALGVGIGMGYVDAAHAAEGSPIFVEIRQKAVPATVFKPPFRPKDGATR